jgi:hypothetical protein
LLDQTVDGLSGLQVQPKSSLRVVRLDQIEQLSNHLKDFLLGDLVDLSLLFFLLTFTFTGRLSYGSLAISKHMHGRLLTRVGDPGVNSGRQSD